MIPSKSFAAAMPTSYSWSPRSPLADARRQRRHPSHAVDALGLHRRVEQRLLVLEALEDDALRDACPRRDLGGRPADAVLEEHLARGVQDELVGDRDGAGHGECVSEYSLNSAPGLDVKSRTSGS